MALSARELVAIARTKARTMMPHLTYQILSAQAVERPGLGTMAVDRWLRIYYDPAFVTEKAGDMEYLAKVIIHEVLHPMLQHHSRCAGLIAGHRDGQRIGALALDAAVNDIIAGSGFTIPSDGITPERLGLESGLTAEEYFAALVQRAEEQPQQQSEGSDKGDDQPAEGAGDRSGSKEGEGVSEAEGGDDDAPDGEPDSGEGEGDDEGQDGDDGAGDPGDGKGQEGDGEPRELAPGEAYNGPTLDRSKGEDGSGADGIPKSWECGPPSLEVPGLSEQDQEVLSRVVAQAIEHSPSCGKGHGGLDRWAERILHPRRDPLAVLEGVVRASCQTGPGYGLFSYRYPSRRQPAVCGRLPVHRQPIPRVSILVDGSGSMDDETDIAEALGVIGKVLKGLPPEAVRVYTGDEECGPAQRVFRPEQVNMDGLGGGTDVGGMLETVAKDRPEPDVILAVTDGFTDWPKHRLRPRVIAYLTRKAKAASVPPWAVKIVAEK
jgi:predicted metal-dependent peptidase